MDQGLPSAGGRTPCVALSAPSTLVLEARSRGHYQVFGRAVTGLSEKFSFLKENSGKILERLESIVIFV
jgi:hypothetical protein